MKAKKEKLIKFELGAMPVLEKFFNEEFVCHCGECKDYSYNKKDIERLLKLRELVNRPIKIMNAHCCDAYPISCVSSHTRGREFDLKCHGITGLEFMRLANLAGFKNYCFMNGFMHVSGEN